MSDKFISLVEKELKYLSIFYIFCLLQSLCLNKPFAKNWIGPLISILLRNLWY